MLTNVPTAVNRMARNVVMHHPNTTNCQLFRRVSAPPAVPAPAAVGVLDEEDDTDIEYAWIGNGYALQAEQFAPSMMMDRQDANNGSANEFRMLIEPEAQSGEEGWFDVRNRDIIYLLLSDDPSPPRLAFEVVGQETMVNLTPYCPRYICNRRDDLHVQAGP